MNKLFSFLSFVFLLTISTSVVYAVTPTPGKTTPTPTAKVTPVVDNQTQQSQIEKIKDLVASKVAELKLVDKRGILGTVKSVSSTGVKLVDFKKQERDIDIDELTKFQGGSNEKSFGISDIKPGDTLSALGLFNKDSKKLLARFISRAQNVPLIIEGVIVSKDSKQFTFEVISEDGKKNTISVETSTKTSNVDSNVEVQKFGFSKIEVDQRVLVAGFADPKIKDQINASRVVVFTEVPATAAMKRFQGLLENSAPVSTGSAGKVAPITR